jgi:cold shock CspA family protein
MRGRIKWFSTERGDVFITDERNEDHHFSVRDVVGSALPNGGESAEFDAGHSGRGAFARRVRVVAPAPGKSDQGRARDDRVVCGYCQRRMVPRLITHRGNVERTVCPFCTETYEDFTPDFPRLVLWILGIGVVLSVLSTLLGGR